VRESKAPVTVRAATNGPLPPVSKLLFFSLLALFVFETCCVMV
jgi:hypothetical protein